MQEAASFVSFSDAQVGSAGLNREAPARWQGPSVQAAVYKFEKGKPAGQIRGFDPQVSQKQPAGHGGLTRD